MHVVDLARPLSQRIRQEVLLQYSRRQVCKVCLIVTVTGAHWAPDLRRARAGDSTGGRATFDVAWSGSLCEPRTSHKTIALFTLFNRSQL